MDGADRGARDLERNRRRCWQRTANNNHRTPRRDVDGGGKLQRILAISILSTDKNRDGELQPCPLAFFLLR